MKPIIATLALATLTACATQEQMIAVSAQECGALGYAPGTVEYTQCTERGYRRTVQQQEALAGTLTAWALIEAIY